MMRIGTVSVSLGDCARSSGISCGSSESNNRAERVLRPAVIVRRTGGSNKTRRGARTHSVLASLLQTLRQQGRETLTYRTSVLTAPAKPPLCSLPWCGTPQDPQTLLHKTPGGRDDTPWVETLTNGFYVGDYRLRK
jgi:hypothetical protein